ncbi:CerR family C-terminal domain-containing protein [Aliiruegeria sabulilitoris]|uniref:CerR family C-terminal domain-containing protein n=1 Tax=Aliiruegeria sabulilitoris TaxID=1510458 RepID=UPI0008335310|nr:CerR family C-terminal domain-containing protein [Aliiruegeria sabulilitoris]NDR58790.1 DUF1956 domain-containing protein [Pseudoruegeria sp. M32A2M]
MTASPDHSSPSEQTRRALIDAAITLFGEASYHGTSTRSIALRAGTNVASISYHFGGKEALRIACAEAIAERVGKVLGSGEVAPPSSPEQAAALLEKTIRNFVHFILLEQEGANFVPFMMRELIEEGPALDLIYQTTFEPRHRAFCGLWEIATGSPAESDATRIAVFSLIGQVLYFRIGQSLVKKRMEWERFDDSRVALIARGTIANLRAMIAAAREAHHD